MVVWASTRDGMKQRPVPPANAPARPSQERQEQLQRSKSADRARRSQDRHHRGNSEPQMRAGEGGGHGHNKEQAPPTSRHRPNHADELRHHAKGRGLTPPRQEPTTAAYASERYPSAPSRRARASGHDGGEQRRSHEGLPDAVIFLDIDGVLHSLYGQDLFKESCVLLFEQIVRGTGASIVLSSTWRTQARSTAMVNKLLKQRRLPLLIDRTRDLSEEMRRYVPREVEICEWLDRHPEVTRWIAIDDMDLDRDNTECAHRLRGHFVHTNPSTGLVPSDAELALRLMAQRQRAPSAPQQRLGTADRPHSAAVHTPRRRPAAAEKVANHGGDPRPDRYSHRVAEAHRERKDHALKASQRHGRPPNYSV